MLNTLKILKDVKYYSTIYKHHETLNPKLECDIKKTGDVCQYRTNVKAYMTDWDERKKFESFRILSKFIISCYNSSMVRNNNFYKEEDILQMWGIIYKKDDYAITHDHYVYGLYSFAYYVKVSKKSSPFMISEGFPTKKRIYPQNGMLLIFPSYLNHEVPKQKNDEERIVISGNF
jgi:hypothetical protein